MFDPAKYATVTIVDRQDLDDHLWIVRVRPDCELPYRPGQYVTLGLAKNGHVVERPYSIASAPTEEAIELFLEMVPGGELSEPLHQMPIGTEMLVRKRPKGIFLKDAPIADQAHMMVATVTGVAPYVSMLRAVAQRWRDGDWKPTHPMILLHGASFVHELGYMDELRALDAECPWLQYVPMVSRPWEAPGWTGETGRVEDVVRKYADAAGMAPGNASVFACGHPDMIHKVHATMLRRGFSVKDMHEERYWPD